MLCAISLFTSLIIGIVAFVLLIKKNQTKQCIIITIHNKEVKKMKVGLIDVDSHNFPNLPIMKISAYHKSMGDHVEFVNPNTHYDKVYMSKVFTESSEPEYKINCDNIIRGGSGYNLQNKLPYEIEHIYPDYSIYPNYDYAVGWLTRGCPRVNHTFCITPIKDGCKSLKVADLSEFWTNQKRIVLLDQNILACKEHIDLLYQLQKSKAQVEFNGGVDIRFLNERVIDYLRKIKIKDYHFAWDDPREKLEDKFLQFKDSGLKNPNQVGVYVLTNFWSSLEEDFYRIYKLRSMGFMPYIMIYDRQKFVDDRGRWLPDVENKFTYEQIIHFKTLQHMQRWCNNRKFIKLYSNGSDFNTITKIENFN